MNDNGYKESTFNILISDLLNNIRTPNYKIISLQDTSTIGDAIKVMEENNISQLPIYSNNSLKGVVSEKNLLRPIYDGEYTLKDSISLVCNPTFKSIDKNELLSNATMALTNKEVVLVTDQGKVIDILTNIDVLNYISQHGDL